MYGFARISASLALALALVSCSGSQSGSSVAPLAQPASAAAKVPVNPPTNHLPKRSDLLHPNEIVGGGTGGGKQLMVTLGDVALPNGSKIQAVNLGIDQISATDAYGNVTTVAQYTSPQVVNVLAYQGGATTPIALGNVAATTYTSLTIVVDTATSTLVGAAGASRPLSFASGSATHSTSGFGASTSTAPGPTPGSIAITFSAPFQVAGSSLDVDVDFNAMESIFPGTATVNARPSLSVAQEGYEGSIAGTVANASGGAVYNAVVVAVDANGNVKATAPTDSSGNFLLHTLAAGTYQIQLYNQYVGAAGWAVSSSGSTAGSATGPVQGPSVTVTPGQSANAGTIAD